MTVLIANVDSTTDTFGQWIGKTNQAIETVRVKAVTTNSNTAVGNAAITGTFTANVYYANTNIFLGSDVSNVVSTGEYTLMRAGPSVNTYYTANGMTLNGTVLYKSNIMQMGNTTIRTANITSDEGFFKYRVKVGTTLIETSRIYADSANLNLLYVANNATFGDPEANVYLNRDGLQIFCNPTGTQVQNSRMTCTTLYIRDIYANNITANVVAVTGEFKVITGTGSDSIQMGNTFFFGTNNHFAYGLTSNGNVGIGNRFYSPRAWLHIQRSAVPTAQGINSNSSIVLDSTDAHFIEFRSPTNTGKNTGMIFVDDNQGGYVVYQSGGGVAGYTDRLRIGAHTGINFEIGTASTLSGVASKQQVAMRVENTGAIVNGDIRLLGSSSGFVTLKANTAAGSPSFTFPDGTGTADQVLYTDGTGILGWRTVPTVTSSTDLRLNSLGVGTAPSGVTGEIRATDNITAYYTSDINLKENIINIENSLSKVLSIRGVNFDWKDSYINMRGGEDSYFVRKKDVGVIAQEIESVLPEAVATREDGTKAVAYEKIIPLLIESIRDLKNEIDILKSKYSTDGGYNK